MLGRSCRPIGHTVNLIEGYYTYTPHGGDIHTERTYKWGGHTPKGDIYTTYGEDGEKYA